MARAKLRFNLNCRNEEEVGVLFNAVLSTDAVILARRKYVGPLKPNRSREASKIWWDNAYYNWDDKYLKDRFRISKQTFNFILNAIYQFTVKTSKNRVLNPIEREGQLGLIYRLSTWVFTSSCK